jgi:RES domain-containing protein
VTLRRPRHLGSKPGAHPRAKPAGRVFADDAVPRTALVRRNDTHRLITSKYSEGGNSVLARIADDDAHLADIFELDNATNERLIAESNRQPGIGIDELVFGVPHHRIVNAAFCHPHPLGSRFNGPDRGAWYAAFELKTAQAEVAFHKAVELAEVDWQGEESVTYDDYLADFSAEFHDLRQAARFADCLAPKSYAASQDLAERLRDAGSLGVVYPSVRRAGGTCVACFRPALVMNVRKARTYRFIWKGRAEPKISALRPV